MNYSSITKVRKFNTTNNGYSSIIASISMVFLILMCNATIHDYKMRLLFGMLFASCNMLIFLVIQYIVFGDSIDIALIIVFAVLFMIFMILLSILYINNYYDINLLLIYLQEYIHLTIVLFLLMLCGWYYVYNILTSLFLLTISCVAIIIVFVWMYLSKKAIQIIQYLFIILIAIYLSILLLYHTKTDNNQDLHWENINQSFKQPVEDLKQYITTTADNSIVQVVKYANLFTDFYNNNYKNYYTKKELASYWYHNHITPLINYLSNNNNRHDFKQKLNEYQQFYNALIHLDDSQFQILKIHLENTITHNLYKNQNYNYYEAILQTHNPLYLHNYVFQDSKNNINNYYDLIQNSFPMTPSSLLSKDIYINYLNIVNDYIKKPIFDHYMLIDNLYDLPEMNQQPIAPIIKQYYFNGQSLTISFYQQKWYIHIQDGSKSQIVVLDKQNNCFIYHKNANDIYNLAWVRTNNDLFIHPIQPQNCNLEYVNMPTSYSIVYNNALWNYNNTNYSNIYYIADLRDKHGYLYGINKSISRDKIFTYKQEINPMHHLINQFNTAVNLYYPQKSISYDYYDRNIKQQYNNNKVQYYLNYDVYNNSINYGHNGQNIWSISCNDQFDIVLFKRYESNVAEIVSKI